MPPEEKNVADRVNELADCLHEAAMHIGTLVEGLAELDIPAADVIDVALHKYPPGGELGGLIRETADRFGTHLDKFVEHVRGGTVHDLIKGVYDDPVVATIERLLRDAPRLNNDPTQSPARDMHILFRGNPTPLYGAVSKADGKDMYRMLQVASVEHNGQRPQQKLLESFFHVSEVQSVMVERDVKAAPASPIIIAS